MKKFGILNGPNLDRLGAREPGIYGSKTMAEVISALASEFYGKCELSAYQSNHEGALIDKLWEWSDQHFDGVVFNPGAFTHTSIALRDAISGTQLQVVEVHISNIYRRETFRHHSHTAGVSEGVISGLGVHGYSLALQYLLLDE